jgi:hypothetical protein
MTGNTYLKTFVSEFSAEYTETPLRFDNFAAVILSCFSTPYLSAALKEITGFFYIPAVSIVSGGHLSAKEGIRKFTRKRR